MRREKIVGACNFECKQTNKVSARKVVSALLQFNGDISLERCVRQLYVTFVRTLSRRIGVARVHSIRVRWPFARAAMGIDLEIGLESGLASARRIGSEGKFARGRACERAKEPTSERASE